MPLHINAHPDSFRANADMAVLMAAAGDSEGARRYSEKAFAVSDSERKGDSDIRGIALSCMADAPVSRERVDSLGDVRDNRT